MGLPGVVSPLQVEGHGPQLKNRILGQLFSKFHQGAGWEAWKLHPTNMKTWKISRAPDRKKMGICLEICLKRHGKKNTSFDQTGHP